MYKDTRPTLGANAHAHLIHVLPPPNTYIQRQLHRFVQATGLAYDATLATHYPLLQHCIFLPEAGLLVTATRAQAPLLGANCAMLARVTDLDVLLLRFCAQLKAPSQNGVGACLIAHEAKVHIVAHEGYRAIIPPRGGLVLRHVLRNVPDFQVRP